MSGESGKRSSAEYRRWTLDQWCEHVKSLGVTTLTQWANTSRGTYNRAVTLGIQREIARALGWRTKLEKGEMLRMTDDDFAERFRAKGVRSVTDMWKTAQHWSEFLRREGRLERVASLLGFGYVQSSHPGDVDYYLKRCQRVGDLTAWRFLDKQAAEAARKHGLMNDVAAKAPRRPRCGYPTSGGRCQSLPELGLARVLEANDVPFVTQMPYPFTFPRGLSHKSKSDFYLATLGAFIEVWAVDPDDRSEHWESYQVRRRFKTSMCDRLNLRLINIEGWLLFKRGFDIYHAHLGAVLESETRLCLEKELSAAEALALNPL